MLYNENYAENFNIRSFSVVFRSMKKVKCNLIWKFPAKIRIFASLQDKYFIYAEHVKDSHDFCVF